MLLDITPAHAYVLTFLHYNQKLLCSHVWELQQFEQYTLLCIMTWQGLMPARNVGFGSHQPEKLNNSKWPLLKFSRAMTTITSAFLAGIKPCDVIMHKVYRAWKLSILAIGNKTQRWIRFDKYNFATAQKNSQTTQILKIEKRMLYKRETY